MQVDPTRLVELAASSEAVLASMVEDWAVAVDDLAGACDALGDAAGTTGVAAAHAASLSDAGEVVAALAEVLGMGVAGLVDAARDALRADDAVAADITRAQFLLDPGAGRAPGRGGR